jgi:hypothetical protein
LVTLSEFDGLADVVPGTFCDSCAAALCVEYTQAKPTRNMPATMKRFLCITVLFSPEDYRSL